MTNFELIKNNGVKEFANLLCSMFEKDCDTCPFTHMCWNNHNGALSWLNDETSLRLEKENDKMVLL